MDRLAGQRIKKEKEMKIKHTEFNFLSTSNLIPSDTHRKGPSKNGCVTLKLREHIGLQGQTALCHRLRRRKKSSQPGQVCEVRRKRNKMT